MYIQQADSALINESDRNRILSLAGVSAHALLAKGTEAEVYDCGSGRLLKIYAGLHRLPHFNALRAFYDSIDAGDCGFNIPQIHDIFSIGGSVGVIESKIAGVTLESVLSRPDFDLNVAEKLYFEAADVLRHLKLLRQPSTYLLFDQSGRSSTNTQSWSVFYGTLLQEKLDRVGSVLKAMVPDFEFRQRHLRALIIDAEPPVLSVVHGDYYPGNVLVQPDGSRVTGIVDFGSFTLFGDHVLDLACAFTYYRMYDSGRIDIRKRTLPMALAPLLDAERQKFFMYLLSNAIVTCDLYVTTEDPQDNGHFCWAVELLRQKEYWDALL